jgi:hypothetical protein
LLLGEIVRIQMLRIWKLHWKVLGLERGIVGVLWSITSVRIGIRITWIQTFFTLEGIIIVHFFNQKSGTAGEFATETESS